MSGIFRFIPVAGAAGAAGVSFYKIYQHTFNAENESIKMSCYGDLKHPLDSNIQNAVDQVVDKLLFKVSPKQMAMTQFYCCNKPSIQYMGSTQSRFGIFIGIPVHYRYQHHSEVDLSAVQSDLNNNKDNSELLDRLKKSLVLSEDAKKFAISSQFFSADSFHLLAKANYIAVLFGFYMTVSYGILPYMGKASLGLAYVSLASVACFWLAVSHVLSRLYYTRLTTSSDGKAALLGEDFLEGGLEYLTKTAEKNMALRELNPNTAAFMFKPNGDKTQSIFDIHEMTLSERLEKLKKLKEKQKLKAEALQKQSETMNS